MKMEEGGEDHDEGLQIIEDGGEKWNEEEKED